MYDQLIYNISLILLFVGLFFLLIGYLIEKRRESHFLLIIGWVTFGLFWLLQVPHFTVIGDFFNATFCFLGFVLFLYFTFHEILNIKWNENLYSLNYLAGVTAVAGIFYYLIEKVEPLAKGLIYIVAAQSVWLTNLFGMDLSLGKFARDPLTNEIGLGLVGSKIGIVLACTGIQSIAIFIAILVVTKSNRNLWVPWTKDFLKKKIPKEIKNSKIRGWLWQRKKKRMKKIMKMSDIGRFFRAFLFTIPVIYFLNIFRNALIIWGDKNSVLGPNTFDIAHNYLSKVLSLIVLIILLFLVFELLPEALEGVMGLFDLPKRTRQGMVKDGFIEFGDKIKPEASKNNTLEKKNNKKLKKSIKDKDHDVPKNSKRSPKDR